jgi:hypothetical protein
MAVVNFVPVKAKRVLTVKDEETEMVSHAA